MKNVKKESEKLIKTRYQRMGGKFTHTIERLGKHIDFEKTFKRLKKKKYPDWVIYMAIVNLAINYRVNASLKDKPNKNPYDFRDMFIELMNRKETDDDLEVPLSEFTEEKIEIAIETNIISFLKGEGYEIRRTTPNIKALRRLAETKFEYFKHDTPHKKWFDFEKKRQSNKIK